MLSDNIRKYRKLNHMSQDELADKLKVTRQSISLWETGQTQPSLENIVALAKLFDVTTDKLLLADEPENVPAPPQKPKNDGPSTIKYILIAFLILCLFLLIVLVPWSFGLFDKESKREQSDPIHTRPISTTAPPETDPGTTAPSQTNPTTTAPPQTKPTTTAPPQTKPTTTAPPQTKPTTTAPPQAKPKDIYGYLKNFVIQNGTVNGDYCYYSDTADNYGGYASERFSLYYWADTEKIEFCLHSVLSETFSINFYIYVPKTHTGRYTYISSYYYRDTGASLYEATGTIVASEFTKNYPLPCSRYIGSTDKQNEFMEMSRQGICDLLDCLENFLEVENMEYSFEDLGFTKF